MALADEPASRVLTLSGGLRLDVSRCCLLRSDGSEIPLRRKSFDVLRYLAENAGRLVGRAELMEAVWRGVYVNEDSATQCVAEVRRALGDDGRQALRTVAGRGYVLDVPAPVERREATPPGRDENPAGAGIAPPPGLPQAPSLAVLPFDNIGDDPEQAYFADGLVEELTSALSRIRALFVIARNSSFTFKDRAVDMHEAGRELGVRYLLRGSVRRAGPRIRVAVQLVDATAGAQQVWGDRFEGTLDDIFGLQDRIAEAIAGAVEPSLRHVEIERARRKPTERLDAYDLYLRALPAYYAMTREGSDAALALLRRAIAADPGYSLAKAFAARTHLSRAAQGWSGPGDTAEGIRLAREALADHHDDPATLRLAGHALTYLAYEHEEPSAALERALRLNPNSAEVLGSAAWMRLYNGDPASALPLFERATRLSPLDPETSHFLGGCAYGRLMLGEPAKALPPAQGAVRQQPRWPTGHRALIVAQWLLGACEAARDAVRRHRAETPSACRVFAERNARLFLDRAFAETLSRALREAGLPE
ncbi:winged helix-turn-helix domain-containing protein [Falsiroseomonas oryzae]|uniref:winged helix-turn-helix domain-containing protein n=1 Tax=Falsiroseomonas oryzae TaxID=2766473 RepID=UPI0022EB86BC|nr:winged helix-turn-helix domain-containing protein [Roseomonas sp. MO-31]